MALDTMVKSETVLFAAGDIELNIISRKHQYNYLLTFRSEIYFNDNINNDFGPDIALGIRYRWSEYKSPD